LVAVSFFRSSFCIHSSECLLSCNFFLSLFWLVESYNTNRNLTIDRYGHGNHQPIKQERDYAPYRPSAKRKLSKNIVFNFIQIQLSLIESSTLNQFYLCLHLSLCNHKDYSKKKKKRKKKLEHYFNMFCHR